MRDARSQHDPRDGLAFVVPALSFVTIPLVGQIFLSEVLLLLSLPYLTRITPEPLGRRGKWFLFLSGVWLVSQMYTDVVRATPFEDWSRGWSKIVMFISNFCAIRLLIGTSAERAMRFAMGLGVAAIAKYVVSPSDLAIDHWWKFGVGPAITLLLVVAASRRNVVNSGSALSILALAAALNLGLGLRSGAGLCMLAIFFVAYTRRPRKMRLRAPTLVLSGLVLVYLISQAYGYVAASGWLGDEQRQKYETQSGGEFGLLLGARVELFASSQAILESPIVGHGSWAKDFEYVALLNERLQDFGYEIPITFESDLLPSHSYFLGAWVEAGVFGAIFWLFIIVVTGRALVASLESRTLVSVLVAFLGFQLVWDVFFSPFGAEHRIAAAFQVALMIVAGERRWAVVRASSVATSGQPLSSGRPAVGAVGELVNP